MNKLIFMLVLGLAWCNANTLTITGQTENVDDGGLFAAFLSSDPSQQLLIACVDFRNFDAGVSTVNVTNLADLIEVTANTRYGQTLPAGFSTQTVPALIGFPQERYIMAAWLVEQYNFAAGVTVADDEIQNAIWTLLDTNGTSGFPFGDALGTGTYLPQAESWFLSQSIPQLLDFANGVRVFTSTDVAGVFGDARYSTGTQEMIGFVSVPEPNAAWFAGAGLALIMCVRARRWRTGR